MPQRFIKGVRCRCKGSVILLLQFHDPNLEVAGVSKSVGAQVPRLLNRHTEQLLSTYLTTTDRSSKYMKSRATTIVIKEPAPTISPSTAFWRRSAHALRRDQGCRTLHAIFLVRGAGAGNVAPS